jgi:hypothetical protein
MSAMNMSRFKTPKFIWTVVVSIGVVLGVIGGVLSFDDRYVKCEALTTKLEAVEIKTVQSLEAFEARQNMASKNLELQLLDIQYQNSLKRYHDLRRRVQNNPNDSFLKNEYDEVKEELRYVKERKRQVMR